MYNKIYKKSIIDINDNMVGKIFKTSNCGDVLVLGKIPSKFLKSSHSRYIIKFINTGYITDYQKHDIIKGKLKDPYSISVCGIGFLGTINYNKIYDKELYRKLYTIWKNMITRCYCVNHSKYYSYGGKGIYVSTRWHNFTNFYYDSQKLPGYDRDKVILSKLQLDKDKLSITDKKYSRKNCCWLSRKENNNLIDRKITSSLSTPIIVYHPNGNITHEISIRECCRKYNLEKKSISNCLKGISKHHKGYKFEYYKE